MFELSQTFQFDAAHTLRRKDASKPEVRASRRIHGHSYTAEVSLRGEPSPETGMLLDLAVLRAEIAVVRDGLDHHHLDEVPGLGAPTLENLCVYIHRALKHLPGLHAVTVSRASTGDRCRYVP